ncbi:MAG TPA: PQQ-binding-like beta-propeller repeat protein [Gemmataceae bacterium]|nr:PQQ-binding-like beta-propeller repeat protein [Gemmataceae bacterium]
MSRLLPLCGLTLMFAACAHAAEIADSRPKPFDWPQWQGPDRTAVSKETGLLKEWPKAGPPLVWKAKGLGGGFSTPSVAAGRIFGMSYRGDDEGVWALDEATGQELWWTRIAKAGKVGHGEGSRCTPTVDGELVYALGTGGDLVCLNVKDGKEVWHKNLQADFKGRMMSGWGYSESPLIDGDKLICTPGGKEATLVALNKKTGELIWKAPVPGGDGAGYASAIPVDFAGRREYVQFLGKGVVGVEAESGKFLWRYDHPANGTCNAETPIYHDGYVFASSAYNAGGGLAKLSSGSDGAVKAEEVWFTNKQMRNHHGGVILLDGYLYGANGGNEGGFLICLDFKTGKVMWDERDKPGRRGVSKGSVALADGRVYYRQEDGTMILFEPSPKEYLERGRFQQPDRSRAPAWSHPVIANGKLYLRDQDVLFCYDVKAK